MITAEEARKIQEKGSIQVAFDDYFASVEKSIRLAASYGLNRAEYKIDRTDAYLSMVIYRIIDKLRTNGFTAYRDVFDSVNYDVLLITW